MASFKTTDSLSKEKIILTEEDIPGATIARESVQQCTVVQLRRWLLCRGAKTSGKKASLITRYDDLLIVYVLPSTSCKVFSLFTLVFMLKKFVTVIILE